MGRAISDESTGDILYQLKHRFGGNGPLQEMMVIQKEFSVFSAKYSLTQAFRILNIVPDSMNERKLWFRFLDELKNYTSDQAGVNGHDRVVKAYQENLESSAPLPMYTTTHAAGDDANVRVSRGFPINYESQEYVVISIPTTPAAQAKKAAPKK